MSLHKLTTSDAKLVPGNSFFAYGLEVLNLTADTGIGTGLLTAQKVNVTAPTAILNMTGTDANATVTETFSTHSNLDAFQIQVFDPSGEVILNQGVAGGRIQLITQGTGLSPSPIFLRTDGAVSGTAQGNLRIEVGGVGPSQALITGTESVAQSVTGVTLNNGQLLIGATSAAPAAGSIVAGNQLAVVGGTNSIKIAESQFTVANSFATSTALTAAQVIYAIVQSTDAGAITFTMPDASAVQTALIAVGVTPIIGTSFPCMFVASGAGAMTISGGSANSFVAPAVAGSQRMVIGLFTAISSAAITYYG